jgi:hypothetical protein
MRALTGGGLTGPGAFHTYCFETAVESAETAP